MFLFFSDVTGVLNRKSSTLQAMLRVWPGR